MAENDFSNPLEIINLEEPTRGRYPNVTDTFTILLIIMAKWQIYIR